MGNMQRQKEFDIMIKENIKPVIDSFQPSENNEKNNMIFQQKAQDYYYNVIGISSNDIWEGIDRIANELYPDGLQ